MSVDVNQVAGETIDYHGQPPAWGSDNWWDNVKKWIEDYIKPLVPAAELGAHVLAIINAMKNFFRRSKA